jgi:PAS domain S-box-containing protein
MDGVELQRDFLGRMDWQGTFGPLLDLLPDVAFFMKDLEGRFVMHNRRACEFCHAASEEETLGKTDFDFWPPDRAQSYVESDRRVMATGQPILNAIAAAPEEAGSENLILYSKVPVRDRSGKIIGLAGIYRELDNKGAAPSAYGRMGEALHAMHKRHAEDLQMSDLAAAASLSKSQFNRKFSRMFGTTPREYLLRVRTNAACRLLETTDLTVTAIALETGFFDHSHFTRTFRRIMHITPGAYRHRHAPESTS